MFAGWDGIKDERGRNLLIDIKAAVIKYGDIPLHDILGEHKKFIAVEQDIMFIHIREPKEIMKLKKHIDCVTLLITRDQPEFYKLENDKNTTDFNYDYSFDNHGTKEESGERFVKLLREMLDKVNN